MQSKKPSRRSVLKTSGGSAAFASAVGVGSAETRQGTTETPSDPPYDFEYKTVGDDVRDAVGHLWWLLSVDRDRIDELLAKSPASTKATRRKQEAVDELRSTYRVELERDEQNGRELTYHLVDPTVRPLQETETGLSTMGEANSGKEAAKSVAESVSAGLQQEAEPKIQPMHSGSIHKKMAVAAIEGTDLDIDTERWNIDYKEAATDPDGWTQKCKVCSNDWMSLGDRFDYVDISPDAIEERVRKAIREIDDSASPHHMYVPGGEEFEVDGLLRIGLPPFISLLEVEVTGAAPRDAQKHWEGADDVPWVDANDLAHAFHFLQDMSHPLHTGAIGPQVLNTQGTIHEAYASFVNDNWETATDTSKALSDRFKEGTENPMWDGSMEEVCKTVANNSSHYSEQVYETILNNGPNNRDDWDDIVEHSADSSIWFTGAYSRGAVNQL